MINKEVLVTTDYNSRGVFGGTLLEYDKEKGVVLLKDARMCIKWTTDMHGVLGLASYGPSKDCRISPCVPKVSLNSVNMVVELSQMAIKNWIAEPWGEDLCI